MIPFASPPASLLVFSGRKGVPSVMNSSQISARELPCQTPF